MLKIKIDHKIHTHTVQHSLYLPLLHCSVDMMLLQLCPPKMVPYNKAVDAV